MIVIVADICLNTLLVLGRWKDQPIIQVAESRDGIVFLNDPGRQAGKTWTTMRSR